MAHEFCPHLAVAHTNPQTEIDYQENVTCIIDPIQALFDAIYQIDDDLAVLASLGSELCSELRNRVTLLCHHPRQSGTDENDVASQQ